MRCSSLTSDRRLYLDHSALLPEQGSRLEDDSEGSLLLQPTLPDEVSHDRDGSRFACLFIKHF